MPKEQTEAVLKRFDELNPLGEMTAMQWDFANANGSITMTALQQRQHSDEDIRAMNRAEEKIKSFLLQEISTARNEVREAIQCEECKGSGAYSTPSDESPCSQCNGTGFSQDGSCNDLFASFKLNK